MPELRKTTKSYAGRQVDIELLQHVSEMLAKQKVEPDLVSPKIVSGIEKAVQRYAKLLLTHIGTVKTDRSIGNTMLRDIGAGMVSNISELDNLYSVANANAMDALMLDDGDDAFGDIPDDERIVRTNLIDMELRYDPLTGGRVYIHVFIETASGDGFTFVVPVPAGLN